MLKSDMIAYEAADLVGTLYGADDNGQLDEFAFAEKLRELPKHWGTLEALMYYDAMVKNGGHIQYFVNSDGAFLDLVEEGLLLFASDYHQNLFKRALHRYDSERYSGYATIDINVPTEEENWRSPYDDLDSLYFKSEPTLPYLVEKFIRGNLNLFRG